MRFVRAMGVRVLCLSKGYGIWTGKFGILGRYAEFVMISLQRYEYAYKI